MNKKGNELQAIPEEIEFVEGGPDVEMIDTSTTNPKSGGKPIKAFPPRPII